MINITSVCSNEVKSSIDFLEEFCIGNFKIFSSTDETKGHLSNERSFSHEFCIDKEYYLYEKKDLIPRLNFLEKYSSKINEDEKNKLTDDYVYIIDIIRNNNKNFYCLKNLSVEDKLLLDKIMEENKMILIVEKEMIIVGFFKRAFVKLPKMKFKIVQVLK